jgi:hypothetical protein
VKRVKPAPILKAVVAIACFVQAANAAEIRLALTPKITLPKDSPVYFEDPVTLFGTNIALLTSGFLRARAEAQLRKSVPALRVEANRIGNTSIISVTAKASDDSLASAFLSALVDQFMHFKRDQKAKYYRDAINNIDTALTYVPPEYAKQLEAYKQQLVIASLVDNKPDFERVDY